MINKHLTFSLLTVLSLIFLSVSVLGASNYHNNYDWENRPTFRGMLCKSDINNDGIINLGDLSIISQDMGKNTHTSPQVSRSDIDGSGTIGLRDFKLLQRWFGMDVSEICEGEN